MKGENKTHELKILPTYYNEVENGIKNFELRKDDRDYRVGDYLKLKEWNNEYTGRVFYVRISYILKNCPDYGLKKGYVILGF